jgi:hypothetical protein
MNAISRFSLGVGAVISAGISGAVQAEPKSYSDQAEFAAALPAEPSILDFDRLSAGATIADAGTAEGITFRYDFDGLRMKVTHLYATTSAPNFLGTNDGGVFHDGDDFSLSFLPGNAVGLYFISADPLIDGDLTVTAAGVTASLAADAVQETLPDGSRVYFLGIIDVQAPFEMANVVALSGGFFLYNVDDIITLPAKIAGASNSADGAVASHQPQLAAGQAKSGVVDR